ncbi:MAG TPA: NAD-dependent epimerase/dehydratase family protein [Thermoanaerobaculia bacterium]|jgi:nucleoside-diphosphate-sugar epimerase|nr:NAD-dependent epimerase/dehydratase family protein [Thermoanaerobaculia bacterium]
MYIFVTGATGYIGHAVVGELVALGHEVTGLVRDDAKAELVRRLGARAVVGDIADPDSYREHAAEHDALVHTAFSSGPGAVAADRTAVETLIAAARAGKARSLVYTSGIWVLGATGDAPAFEGAPTDHPMPLVSWRPAHERLALEAGIHHLASAVIRPGIVYGGRGGLTGSYFESAEKEGAAAYVGDGTNRLPMIHVEDLARFYRRVVEHHARGVFHAVDGNAVPLSEVARAASEAAGKGGAARSIPLAQARQTLGAFADCLALDQFIESRRAAELGWRPEHPNFLGEAAKAYLEWKSAQA